MLSLADHDRIATAVAQAEAQTAGEILCVLARKVSDYRETPLAWGAGAALILPALGVAFGLHPWLISQAGGDWVATNAVALDVALDTALFAYALIQIAIFAVVSVTIAAITPLKLALTPSGVKQRRVRRAALHHLATTRLLGGQGGAVVIFASDAERMVAVVADEALHAKAGDKAWQGAVGAVLSGIRSGDPTSGFVAAVELCGGYLAEHFPAQGVKHNALSDRLLEL